LAGKKVNRAAVQKHMRLDPDPDSLLACVVSRLTHQKGIDLLGETLTSLIGHGCQLALLGTGAPELETMLEAAMKEHPGRVGGRIAYDEALSHLLIAGSDAILVPSRYEPSGLTQLYGLRYGTIPIVARTGGLADSVIDANLAAVTAGAATGIVFDPIDADGLRQAYNRATDLFSDRTVWHGLILAAMNQTVGWRRSASRYAALYGEVVQDRRRAVTK
jgi:starch synthase